MTTAGPTKNIFILPGITGPTGLFEIVNILNTGPTNGTGATGDLPHRLKTFNQMTGPAGSSGPTGTFKTVCYAGASGLTGKRTIIVPGYAAGGGGGGASVWSPTDNTNGAGDTMTLTNAGLTATHSAGSGFGGIRSTVFKTAGKLYAEMSSTHIGFHAGAGLSNTAGALNNERFSSTGQVFLDNSGTIQINNAAQTPGLTAFGTGAIVEIAADFTNKRVWFRNSLDANWNASGTANPATNVGGIDITAFVSTGLALFFGCENQTDVCTINVGGSAFTGTIPVGFSAWG